MESDAQFAFSAQPTERQLAAAVRYISRPFRWFLRIFGVLVVLYGLFMVFFMDAPPEVAALFLALGLLVGLILPDWKIRKAIRASARRVGRPTEYRIDAAGLYSRNDLTDGTIRWPLIRRVDELSDLVLVRVARAMFVPVPIGQLTPEARSALLAFLRAHAGGTIPPAPTAAPTAPPPRVVLPEPSPIRPPTPSA